MDHDNLLLTTGSCTTESPLPFPLKYSVTVSSLETSGHPLQKKKNTHMPPPVNSPPYQSVLKEISLKGSS